MPRYLIDANLPRHFSPWNGPDNVFVHDMRARWSDTQIWHHALSNALTIVSKDTDFSDRIFASATCPRVVHVRVGNMRMRDFHALVTPLWSEICRLSETHRLVQVFKDTIECIE